LRTSAFSWLARDERRETTTGETMAGRSPSEREYAVLVAELHALDEEIAAARAVAPRATHGAGLDLHTHRDAPRPPSGEHVRLADGAEIVIRPIEPGDRTELEHGFEHLSALSRLRTFGAPVDHLTSRRLTELTEVDHDSHEALVALVAATAEVIGIARFVRVPDDPAQAEFICTVADRWQRRGVGTALVERLAARAHALGVERFTTVILVGNTPARRLLRRVAREVSEHREGGRVVITGGPRDAAS
jgi:RimJ/RimL family protein N-acetyltransferase